MTTPDDTAADPWSAWRDAARDAAVDRALRDIFTALGDEVRKRAPLCWTSGRCCNFDAFEHRLYVTGLEIAWVLDQYRQLQPPSKPLALKPTGACVFQVDGLCGVHTIRPLGCRIFFCQHGTDDWQHEMYERFLGELRTLHDDHALPYRYMEWRAGLIEAASHGLVQSR